MTQQEYEQKKRECWEDIWSPYREEVFMSDYGRELLIVADKVFKAAFDRAYALGKQTETISQEEIEKAALDYIRTNPFVNFRTATTARESFVDGANFTLGKQEKDAGTMIQGWVARDKNGALFIYKDKPSKISPQTIWHGELAIEAELDTLLFPDLTWDSEPIEVELIIKRKKK